LKGDSIIEQCDRSIEGRASGMTAGAAVDALQFTNWLGGSLVSIKVDNIRYESDGTSATCLGSNSSNREFPRNFVSVHGSDIPVNEMDFGRHGWTSPERDCRLAICVSSYIQTISGGFCPRNSVSAVTFESDSQLFRIERRVFHECKSLRSICIPSSLETLCPQCFSQCGRLSSLTFEPGSRLSWIQDRAFWSCNSLRSICLPAGVEELDAAFAFCDLRAISIADGNCHFKVDGDFLVDFAGISINRYLGRASEVWIGHDIEQLDRCCFSGISTVSSVIFESDCRVSRIEEFAFSQCSLSSICIPSCVTKLGISCFELCESLLIVTFESGSRLSCLEDGVFGFCSSLSSICVPSSVEKLGTHCFGWCVALSSVTFESGSRLSCIEDQAFGYGRSLSSICIPSSVGDLEKDCFAGCDALLTVAVGPASTLSSVDNEIVAADP
jgi:hypothetical protein